MQISIIAGLFLLFGAFFFFVAIKRLLKRQVASAFGHTFISIIALMIGAIIAAFGINLYTYDRLSYEEAIAELRAIKLGDQRYQIDLLLPKSGTRSQYEVIGDQWLLDARIIKWSPKGNLLGLDAKYRLERLSGRFNDAKQEAEAKSRTIYSLRRNPGLDFSAYAQKYRKYMPYLDTIFGSGVYMPMADKAIYRVYINQSGLSAKPVNGAAEKAVENWQ